MGLDLKWRITQFGINITLFKRRTVMKSRTRYTVAMIFALVFFCFANVGEIKAADKYPSRPVTTIVGFGPGGVSDMTMRLWNKYLEKYMGGTFVVDHKPGAGGILAFSYVANAKPDGYTLLNHSDYFLPVLNGTATFKMEDLRVIAQLTLHSGVLAVSADSPWKTFQDFVDYAKKNPGVKYGHQGAGTMVYFRMENLNRQAGLKLTGVPLKGDAEIVSSLLGKHVAIGTLGNAVAKAQAEAGKLRILFSFDNPKPFGLDPSLPYMDTFFPKIPDIDFPIYLIAPSKTPDDIVNALEKAMEKMSKDPEFAKEVALMNDIVHFVPGKVIMQKLPAKMNLFRQILKDSAPAAK